MSTALFRHPSFKLYLELFKHNPLINKSTILFITSLYYNRIFYKPY